LGFSGAKVIEASAAAIAVSAAVAKIDMRQFVDIVRIPTPGRGLVEITPEVVDWLRPHDVRTGLLTRSTASQPFPAAPNMPYSSALSEP
jgi:hypothetical protein